jgi:carboxypeptidase T
MKSRYRLVLLTLIIVTLVIASGLFIDKNQTTLASDQTSKDISLGAEKSQQVVVKLYYDSREQLNAVAGELDIWEVHPLPGIGPNAGYALAAVYPAQQDWLEVLGYRVEVDQEHTELLMAPDAVLDPRYYYFDENNLNPNGLYMVDFLQDTEAAYPNLTELIDIGDAWLTSHGGPQRDMWVLRITNEDPAYGDIADKPPFFLFANIHAREVTTPEMAIRYIKYLTEGYNGMGGYDLDPDVHWLVNHHVVYVLVSQNPDGRVINEIDWYEWWRKNVDNDDGCADPNSWGIDLNRNHSFNWGCCGGSSGSPCSETYRGPSRGSEPETAAFQDFAATVAFIDQNGGNDDFTIVPAPDDAKGIFISLHSYADEILWPFSYQASPNDAQLETIARKLAIITVKMDPTGNIGYTVDGSSDDWVYGKLGVAAFTYEIGDNSNDCGGFFPDYECQDGLPGASRNFWEDMRESFVYANKIARTPYMTSYGPDATNLAVDPSEVPAGLPVDLSATITDQRYGDDPLKPINAAEYFIDIEGADGTGIPMSPTSGWGGTTEEVVATIDTAALGMGQHYILVHGRNNEGDWGPFTAVFLDITEPLAPLAAFASNSPVQLGQPMNFINQTIGSDPIDYLWDFGDGIGTSTETDPFYTYQELGTYTVTLTAHNEYGDDNVSNDVFVIPPGIDSVALTQVTSDPIFPGDEVDFNVDLLPDNAGKPFNYSIDFGDGTFDSGTSSDDPYIFTHVFNHGGSHTISIQVQNSSMMMPALDSLEVTLLNRIYLPFSIK